MSHPARLFWLILAGLSLSGPAHAEGPGPAIEWRVETPFRLWRMSDRCEHPAKPLALSQANDPCAQANDTGRRLIDDIGRAGDETALVEHVAKHVMAGTWPYRNTHYDRVNRAYRPGYALPEAHAVILAHAGAADRQCLWRIDNAHGEGVEMHAACATPIRAVIETPYGRHARLAQAGAPPNDPAAFSAQAQARVCAHATGDPARCADPGAWKTQPLHVRDRLILGLGDSYASGEGNPDKPVHFPANILDAPPYTGSDAWPHQSLTKHWLTDAFNRGAKPAEWWDAPCRRSLLSWQALSAMKLAASDPHASITFISFACSGAGVYEGLVEPQIDIGKKQTAISQLIAAKQSLCLIKPSSSGDCIQTRQRPVDSLLLNIGGNDVHFADLVRWVMLPAKVKPPLEIIQNLAAPRMDPWQFGNHAANTLPGRLEEAYQSIHKQLNVAPENVWLAEYPSPLAGSDAMPSVSAIDGPFDGMAVLYGALYGRAQLRLTQSESLPAQQNIKDKFYQAYQGFIKGNKNQNWHYIPTADRFLEHGYWRLPPTCDDRSRNASNGAKRAMADPDEAAQCGQCQAIRAKYRDMAANEPMVVPGFKPASSYVCQGANSPLAELSPVSWKPYQSSKLWFRTLNASLYTQLQGRPTGDLDNFPSIAGTAHPTLDGHAAMAWRVLDSGFAVYPAAADPSRLAQAKRPTDYGAGSRLTK